MNLKSFQEKIHKNIPMTKLMAYSLEEINEKALITKIPLDININDKGTGFGGSLSSLTVISGWTLANLLSNKLGFKNIEVVIVKNENSYLKPVTKDIYCESLIPNEKDLENFKTKLSKKGVSSLIIKSHIKEDEKLCVSFEGKYVVKTIS